MARRQEASALQSRRHGAGCRGQDRPLPSGPRGHGLLGILGDLNRDQLGFYTRCAHEHGDVVPVRLGPSRCLLIYHPDAIEEVPERR